MSKRHSALEANLLAALKEVVATAGEHLTPDVAWKVHQALLIAEAPSVVVRGFLDYRLFSTKHRKVMGSHCYPIQLEHEHFPTAICVEATLRQIHE